MNSLHLLQCLLNKLLREEFTECIENDTIADAEEEMERCWNNTIRWDGEERRMSAIHGMFISWLTIARGFSEAVEGNDADGARMRGSGSHETEDGVDEWPVTIEKSSFRVNEMLKECEDMRENSGVALEGCE
jgi:hypothetical protein